MIQLVVSFPNEDAVKYEGWSIEFTDIPIDIPVNVEEIYLDDNNLTVLHSNAFYGFHLCNELYISYNPISIIEQGAFNGLGKLEILDL